MQVNAINNNRTNTNFNAFFEVHGTEYAKKVLPEKHIEAFSKKLEKLGNYTDYFAVNLTENSTPGIIQADDDLEKSRYKYTSIVGAYHFDEIDDKIYTGHLARVYGSFEERSNKTIKIIEAYINMIAANLGK